MSKEKALRLIDQATANKSEGEVTATTPVTTAVRVDTIPGPTNLQVVSQDVYMSTASPAILVTFSWTPAEFQRIDYFVLDVSEESDFNPSAAYQTYQNPTSIVLKPNTLYYVRVATVYEQRVSQFSSTLSFTTDQDLTVPPTPTVTYDWQIGDLVIRFPNTNSDLVKDARVRVNNPAGTINYVDTHANQIYRFTAEENRRLTGDNPLTSVQVIVNNRSWSNVYSANVTATTTSPPPSGVTGLTTSWSGDTGTADEDVLISWNVTPGASEYIVQINNATQYKSLGNSFVYPYPTNRTVNPPSGLASIPVKVWARNKISQSGVLASTTATNLQPTTTGASLSAFAGFSQLSLRLTHADIQDVDKYFFGMYGVLGSTTEVYTDAREIVLDSPASDQYAIEARIIDKFGQRSSAIITGNVYVDSLTISGLRNSAIYSDSDSNNPHTLHSIYADDGVATSTLYTTSASWTKWIRFERALTERYKTVTISIDPVSGTSNYYLRTSLDGNNWTYYSGPVVSSRILTEVANAAAAQSAAVNTSTLGGGGSLVRIDFPELVEARFIELWMRNTSASTRVREYYPRRLVQSDDIEAEAIKAINIGASQVTADKINVISLRAVAINTGDLTISGVLTISHLGDSGLYQGTGTFASPVTGLKIWRDSGGIGRLTTYSGGIVQVDVDSSGRLTAGAGSVLLSASGVRLSNPNNDYTELSSVQFYRDTTQIGIVAGYRNTGTNSNGMSITTRSASSANINLRVPSVSASQRAIIDIAGGTGIGQQSISMSVVNSPDLASVSITPTTVQIDATTVGINDTDIGSDHVSINKNGSGDRNALIDFLSDNTYTSWGMRIVKGAGANGNAVISTRGTGQFQIYTTDTALLAFGTASTIRAYFSTAGHLLPNAAATYNLGDATNYWNDVSYKTLTDRGCLGWFDEGVELQDGRIVPDTEALLSIKKHPSKLTVYGKPMLDYKSLPKDVYKPVDKATETIYEEYVEDGKTKKRVKFKKGQYMGEEGAETTALISIMLGAIKELTLRVKELESKL